jgi:hypothetical protein
MRVQLRVLGLIPLPEVHASGADDEPSERVAKHCHLSLVGTAADVNHAVIDTDQIHD